MEVDSLLGKTLESVWVFPSAPIHPAWVGELTTPINSWDSFLQFSDGEIVQLSPCEVDLSEDKYPSLGLTLNACTREAMKATYPDGQTIDAVALEEARAVLPANISSVEETDPLGEGVTTQYSLAGVGWRIIFRHIMPPMSLGIRIDVVAGASETA
jgi:hypothetical protein